MTLKKLYIPALLCATALALSPFLVMDKEAFILPESPAKLANLQPEGGPALERSLHEPFTGDSLSGNYLSALYAQNNHDWDNAVRFLERVRRHDNFDTTLSKKAMILAMGAGKGDIAMDIARAIADDSENESILAPLFVAAQHAKNNEYEQGLEIINALPDDAFSAFLWPLLKSWSQAGAGAYEIETLGSNTLHLFHAVLIADYLGKTEDIDTLLERSLGAQDLTAFDLERIADLHVKTGRHDKAANLYKALAEQWSEQKRYRMKLDILKSASDEERASIDFIGNIDAPHDGMAIAYYDMATLLTQEHSDESARVFANLALHLNPDLEKARLLIAGLLAGNERISNAIEQYRSIPASSLHHIEAQRAAAELMLINDDKDGALRALNSLVETHGDVDSLIQMGNIHRRNENHEQALTYYNRAATMLGNDLPADYWHLHYVRGMSYEQAGQWSKAEQDLKAALEFQPQHPYVLNYLAYSWADQGINLKQSLDMLQQAVELMPDDGYITDSLGWVYYRKGDYKKAVPHLERAVELLPYDAVVNDHLGDAYWKVGRKLEARFQWQRARNHSEDQKLTATIEEKLAHGLPNADALKLDIVKEARSEAADVTPLNP